MRMKRLQSSIEIVAQNVAGLQPLQDARGSCGLSRRPAAIDAAGGRAKQARLLYRNRKKVFESCILCMHDLSFLGRPGGMPDLQTWRRSGSQGH